MEDVRIVLQQAKPFLLLVLIGWLNLGFVQEQGDNRPRVTIERKDKTIQVIQNGTRADGARTILLNPRCEEGIRLSTFFAPQPAFVETLVNETRIVSSIAFIEKPDEEAKGKEPEEEPDLEPEPESIESEEETSKVSSEPEVDTDVGQELDASAESDLEPEEKALDLELESEPEVEPKVNPEPEIELDAKQELDSATEPNLELEEEEPDLEPEPESIELEEASEVTDSEDDTDIDQELDLATEPSLDPEEEESNLELEPESIEPELEEASEVKDSEDDTDVDQELDLATEPSLDSEEEESNLELEPEPKIDVEADQELDSATESSSEPKADLEVKQEARSEEEVLEMLGGTLDFTDRTRCPENIQESTSADVTVEEGRSTITGTKFLYDNATGVGNMIGPVSLERRAEGDSPALSGNSDNMEFNVDEDLTILQGNVTVESDGRVSEADKVEFDEQASLAILFGDPAKSTKDNDVVQGEVITYYLDSNDVVVDKGIQATFELEP